MEMGLNCFLHIKLINNLSSFKVIMVRGFLKKLLGGAVIALLLFYLFSNLFTNFEELREYTWKFRLASLLFGFVVLVIFNLLAPFIWWKILKSLGGNLPFMTTFKIWALSQSGRYIPGKIWGIVGRVYWAKDIKKIIVLWSAWIETLLVLLSGFILSISLLSFLRIDVKIPHQKTLVFLLFSLIFLHPKLLAWLVSKFTKERPKLRFVDLVIWFFLYVLLWLGSGLGYFWILGGVSIEADWKNIVSMFPVSWILGFLAPFAPGGIGVREGVLTFLLTPSIGPGVAALASIIMRIATTLLDLSLLGIAGIAKLFERFSD